MSNTFQNVAIAAIAVFVADIWWRGRIIAQPRLENPVFLMSCYVIQATHLSLDGAEYISGDDADGWMMKSPHSWEKVAKKEWLVDHLYFRDSDGNLIGLIKIYAFLDLRAAEIYLDILEKKRIHNEAARSICLFANIKMDYQIDGELLLRSLDDNYVLKRTPVIVSEDHRRNVYSSVRRDKR